MLEGFAPGRSWKVLYWLQWLLIGILTFQVAKNPLGGHFSFLGHFPLLQGIPHDLN